MNVSQQRRAVPTTEDYNNQFSNHKEADMIVWKGDIKGSVPENMTGTFFQNGPGIFKYSNGKKNCHPFDGHGHIRSVSFRNGQVLFRSKFVKSASYVKEGGVEGGFQSIMYRGVGSGREGWLANLPILFSMEKNPSNTCVLDWHGRLLSTYEGGLPYRLDPETLHTLGIDDFGGALTRSPGVAFMAHTKRDHERNRLVGVEIAQGMSLGLRILEFSSNMEILSEVPFTFDGVGAFHDFTMTENYYIFFRSGMKLNAWEFMKAMVGAGHIIKSLECDDAKTLTAYVIPRPCGKYSSKVPISIALEGEYMAGGFHVSNACEDDDGNISCLTLMMPKIVSPTTIAAATTNTIITITPSLLLPSPLLPPAPLPTSPLPPSSPPLLHQRHYYYHHTTATTITTTPTPPSPPLPPSPLSSPLRPLSLPPKTFGREFGFNLNDLNAPLDPECKQDDGTFWNADSTPHRIDLQIASEPYKMVKTLIAPRYVDFPKVHPDKEGKFTRYTYALAAARDGIHLKGQLWQKFDFGEDGKRTTDIATDEFYAGPRIFLGEPQFVPRPGSCTEDDGWLVGMGFDSYSKEGVFFITDAADLSAGAVCEIRLGKSFSHVGFHNSWSNISYGWGQQHQSKL